MAGGLEHGLLKTDLPHRSSAIQRPTPPPRDLDPPLNLRGQGSRTAAPEGPHSFSHQRTEPSDFLSSAKLRPEQGSPALCVGRKEEASRGRRTGFAASARRLGDSSTPGSGSKRRGPKKRKEEEKQLLPVVSVGKRVGPRRGVAGKKLGTLETCVRGSKGGVGAEFQGPGSAPNFPKEALPELDCGGAVPLPARGAELRRAPPGPSRPAGHLPAPLPAGPLRETPAPRPGPLLPSAPLSAGPSTCGGRWGPAAPPRASRPAAPRRPRVRRRCCTWCGRARLRATSRGPCPPAASPAPADRPDKRGGPGAGPGRASAVAECR